jgi:hypothetical protein
MRFRLIIIWIVGLCVVSCETRTESRKPADEVVTLWYKISYDQLRKSLERVDPNDPFYDAEKTAEKRIPGLFREAGFREIDQCQSLVYCSPYGYLVVTASHSLHSRIESLIGCKGGARPDSVPLNGDGVLSY